MKPFNLERALAGDPVVTRDGAKVTEIIEFSNGKIVGLITGRLVEWFRDGCVSDIGRESFRDLFMAPKTTKVKVTLFRNADIPEYIYACTDKEACFQKPTFTIKTIEVEIEE